jgi:hypothetical protein
MFLHTVEIVKMDLFFLDDVLEDFHTDAIIFMLFALWGVRQKAPVY